MACPWSCACDPPPPLIKVASNTRPYSKLGGTTLNGREEGGQYYILQTCDQERFEARKVVFPWECLIIFATGCSKVYLFGSELLWCWQVFPIIISQMVVADNRNRLQEKWSDTFNAKLFFISGLWLLAKTNLKGLCHAICYLFGKLKKFLASIEF